MPEPAHSTLMTPPFLSFGLLASGHPTCGIRMRSGPILVDFLGFLRFSRSPLWFLPGPALTLKVTGVPKATSKPGAGFVDTTVSRGKVDCTLRLPVASRPACERERVASRTLIPD